MYPNKIPRLATVRSFIHSTHATKNAAPKKVRHVVAGQDSVSDMSEQGGSTGKVEQHGGIVDATELASLLQCLGFTVEAFERDSSLDPEDATKVEIVCGKSRMRARLTRNVDKCSCPSDSQLNGTNVWNVSGNEPSSQGLVQVANSSQLPSVSSTKRNMVREVLQRILDMMKKQEDDLKSSTSSSSSKGRASLTRHKSMDSVNCTGSPPKLTSSPVHLDAFSGAERSSALVDILVGIIKLGQEAYDKVVSKDGKGGVKKRISDIKPSPGKVIAGNFINMNTTHTREFSLVVKTPTAASAASRAAEKKAMPPPAKKLPIRKNLLPPTNKAGGKPSTPTTTTKNLTPRRDTPRPNASKLQVVTPSGENMPAGISKLRSRIPSTYKRK